MIRIKESEGHIRFVDAESGCPIMSWWPTTARYFVAWLNERGYADSRGEALERAQLFSEDRRFHAAKLRHMRNRAKEGQYQRIVAAGKKKSKRLSK